MTRYSYAIGLGAIFGIIGSVTLARAAEPFDSKLQASTYKTKLVQAVDECVTGTTIIGGLDACDPANVTTDGTQFSVGKITVKSRIFSAQVMTVIKSSGNSDDGDGPPHALGGKVIRTRLVLRVTKRTTTSAPTEPVTWADTVLLCAPVTVNGSGNAVIKQQLTGLAGCNLNLALASDQYVKQIVSASVIDSGSGEAIAVPGIRKKP